MVMVIMRARTAGPAGRRGGRGARGPVKRPTGEVGRPRVSRRVEELTYAFAGAFRAYVRTLILKRRTMGAGPTCFWLVGARRPDAEVGLRRGKAFELSLTVYTLLKGGAGRPVRADIFCGFQVSSWLATFWSQIPLNATAQLEGPTVISLSVAVLWYVEFHVGTSIRAFEIFDQTHHE